MDESKGKLYADFCPCTCSSTAQSSSAGTFTAFTVESGSSLALRYVALRGTISVRGGTATLNDCTLEASVSLNNVGIGGALIMVSMDTPAGVVGSAVDQLSGIGSTLSLSTITVQDVPAAGQAKAS